MKLNHNVFLIFMYMNHIRDKDMGKTCLIRFYRYYLIPHYNNIYWIKGIYLLDIYIGKHQFLVPLILHSFVHYSMFSCSKNVCSHLRWQLIVFLESFYTSFKNTITYRIMSNKYVSSTRHYDDVCTVKPLYYGYLETVLSNTVISNDNSNIVNLCGTS